MDRTPTTEELVGILKAYASHGGPGGFVFCCECAHEDGLTYELAQIAADRVAAADAVIEAARVVLSEVEWTYDGEWGEYYCPSCSIPQSANGHESKCGIQRALDRIAEWKGQE